MENSLINQISVWRNEGRPHQLAIPILKVLLDDGMINSAFFNVVKIDSPFSKKEITACFDRVEKEFTPKETKSLPKREKLPEELRAVRDEISSNYEVISQIKGELKSILYTRKGTPRKSKDSNRSASLALLIVKLTNENRRLFEIIDHFTETGKILTPEKTDPMDELKQAARLLQNQPEAINYIRKQTAYRKKHGNLQNPELFRERELVLKEIREFVEKHG